MDRCQERTEVYSRVCGFFRPVQQWNRGKREEFRERKTYKVDCRTGQSPTAAEIVAPAPNAEAAP